MKKYDEYKDSGVAWIGEVPKHWEVIKLKYKYHFQTGATPNTGKKENFEGELKWANISDLNGSVVYDTTKHINKEAASKCSMNISPKGSLMYSFKLSVGTVAFCGEDMYTNEAIASFIPQKNDLKYLFYCAPIFIIHNANRNIYNAPLLNQELIKNALICLPSLNEQTAIATYLDTHCAKIDNLISIQQKRIALLQELKQSVITHAVTKGLDPNVEMKQSGVEWIGDVPKHWDITKMNNNCSTITDYVASGSFADLRKNVLYLDEPDYAMLIRTADLSSNDRKLPPVYISKCSYEFLSNSNLFGGEVVLPNIGASIGNVYMVPKLYKHMSLAPNAIMVKSCGNDRFLYYYFKSKPGVDSLMLIGMAAAQDKFNKTELRSLKVLVPPLGEQAAIASYLDHKCATIDTSISNAQHQIDLLQEYKQSLITEVVTGKRKVTDN